MYMGLPMGEVPISSIFILGDCTIQFLQIGDQLFVGKQVPVRSWFKSKIIGQVWLWIPLWADTPARARSIMAATKSFFINSVCY